MPRGLRDVVKIRRAENTYELLTNHDLRFYERRRSVTACLNLSIPLKVPATNTNSLSLYFMIMAHIYK